MDNNNGEISVNFHIKNLFYYEDQLIRNVFSSEMKFIEVLLQILEDNFPILHLDQIAVIAVNDHIFTFEDLQMKISEIINIYKNDLTITTRSKVDGPDLLESPSLLIKVDYDELRSEEEMEEEKTSTSKKKYSSISSPEPPKTVRGSVLPLNKPPSPPIPPSSESGESKLPLSFLKSASDSILPPKNRPSQQKDADTSLPPPTSAPSPEPSPSEHAASLEEPSSKKPFLMAQPASRARKAKKKKPPESLTKIEFRSLKSELQEELLDTIKEKSKISEEVLEKNVVGRVVGKEAEEIEEEKFQTYHKNLAIDYFCVMNPDKYYPLVVNISDYIQKTKADQENLFTSERKTQKKDEMEVELLSSIISVKPIFPGCSVTPDEIQTDFQNPEDEIIFYITPLVNDDLDDCRIEFVNSENEVVHSVQTPCKVKDPRYARTVALYGTLASVIPKIFLFFGIDIGANESVDQILPWLQSLMGSLSISNFIGIFGILIALIISLIVYLTRKPKSIVKQFKLADIRKTRPKIVDRLTEKIVERAGKFR